MRKWIPIDTYNFGALEAWLTEMAVKGNRLVKMGSLFADFQPETPEPLSYYIVPEAEDTKSAMQEFNWSFVCPIRGGWEVYCTNVKNAQTPPFQEEALQVLRKKQRRDLWGSLFALLALAFFTALGLQLYAGQFALLAAEDVVMGAYVVLLIFCIQECVTAARRMRWIKQRMAERRDSQSGMRHTRTLFTLVMLGLIAAELILFGVRRSQKWERPAAQIEKEFVTLDMLEGETLSYSQYRKEYGNTATFRTSFLVPEQYDIRLSGKTASGAEPVMKIEQFGTRSVGLAEDMLEALMARNLDWHKALQPQEIHVEGCDKAYMASVYNAQYVFMQKGKQVVAVFYMGEEKLEEKADLFVNMLENTI